MKETEWIPVETQPTILGVYKRKDEYGEIGWQRWCGDYWGFWNSHLSSAILDKDLEFHSTRQSGKWKGLTDDYL